MYKIPIFGNNILLLLNGHDELFEGVQTVVLIEVGDWFGSSEPGVVEGGVLVTGWTVDCVLVGVRGWRGETRRSLSLWSLATAVTMITDTRHTPRPSTPQNTAAPCHAAVFTDVTTSLPPLILSLH